MKKVVVDSSIILACLLNEPEKGKILELTAGLDLIIKLLCHIKKVVDRAKAAERNQLAPQTLKKLRSRFQKILSNAERVNPLPVKTEKSGKRGRIKRTQARNLLERLQKHSDEVLAFMYDFNVPFDNNTSERDLRMTKVKQKISGCFRTMFGAKELCSVWQRMIP